MAAGCSIRVTYTGTVATLHLTNTKPYQNRIQWSYSCKLVQNRTRSMSATTAVAANSTYTQASDLGGRITAVTARSCTGLD